ncbi:MAG: Rab family GTPase [Promethearchaeota archaeon]
MLRQIHIFHSTQHIFVKDYAIAYGNEELKKIKEIILKYMEMPIPGKTFNRKVSNFQIFHRGVGNLYFLFITDQVDSIQYIEPLMEIIIQKFQKLFPNPENINESSDAKNEFINILDQIQKDLRSKITIIGPINAGKTTLYNMLRTNGEKIIMEVAKLSNLLIDDLEFEIWDFQLKDNFSPLWAKFISGSDLVILLFDLSNYNLKIINQFSTLQTLESNFSKILVVGNKRDLVMDEDIKRIKNEINIYDFKEISLNSPDAKSIILQYIKDALGLKRKVPENLEELVKEADFLAENGQEVQALTRYKELIALYDSYQDFEHIKIMQKRIEELNAKLKKKIEKRKEIELKKEFEIPIGLKFKKKKISVKPLPTIKTLDQAFKIQEVNQTEVTSVEEKPHKLVSFQKLDKKPMELNIFKTTELPPKPVMFSKRDEEDIEINESKMPIKLFPPHEELEEELGQRKAIDFVEDLQRFIKEKGSNLSVELCTQLVLDLEESLGRSLSIEDIELAADFFVKQEKIT